MIGMDQLGLNRITAPSLGLAEFYGLASSLGIGKVEIRNDLGKADPIDGMKPAEARRLAADSGVEVITINALQKFNLASARPRATVELQELLELAHGIGCQAIVLCPNCDPADGRAPAQRLAETVDALVAFGPLFETAGVLGYLEPLGFAISSLASLLVATEAIAKARSSCYRIVYDTFHHHIGPDEAGVLGASYDIASTGLVHISGVEAAIPRDAYRDEHRVLVGPADTMTSREQMQRLDRLGYRGAYSFESFAPSVQKLGKADLASALRKSVDYLLAQPSSSAT